MILKVTIFKVQFDLKIFFGMYLEVNIDPRERSTKLQVMAYMGLNKL